MTRESTFQTFFLGLFVLLLVQWYWILEPFLTPLLAALVLAILAWPLHLLMSRRVPERYTSGRAALSTVTVCLMVLGPFLLFFWLLFHEAQSMVPTLSQWGDNLRVWNQEGRWVPERLAVRFHQYLPASATLEQFDFHKLFVGALNALFAMVSRAGQSMARNVLMSIFQMTLVVFSLFFLFRDGERLFDAFQKLVPMRSRDKQKIFQRLRTTVTEIVRGSVLTSLYQTVFSAIGYWITGIPAALTLGLATGICAFIPVIGTALVWVPLGVILLLKGFYGKALFIFLWGAVVIGVLDNVLRTYLIGKNAKLPIFFLFFSIIGGLKFYGVRGLLIGPLLVAIFPIFLDIFREEYLENKPRD